MELQFANKELTCLQQLGCQVLNQEQTTEVRLDDSMPPIGRVLGAWGQVLLRGKEWRNGSVQVSGGVMAWVLYMPEEGGPCQSVETWLPFQWKVDIPVTQRDGTVIANGLLRGVDGRSLSSKKLMVRANVGLKLQTMVPDRVQITQPEEVPEHIRLRKEICNIQLPVEAGEKPFVIDEILNFPANSPQPEKLLHYRLQVELLDKKVMADKVVFRGTGLFHTVYLGQDDRVYACDFETPFAQYADLAEQFNEDACAMLSLAVTGLEVTLGAEGQLQMNAGVTGQYVIFENPGLERISDGYSTKYHAVPEFRQVELPVVTDMQSRTVPCKMQMSTEITQVVDAVFLPEHPMQIRTDNGMCAELGGFFQVLHYTPAGELEVSTGAWSGETLGPAEKGTRMESGVSVSGNIQAAPGSGGISVQGDLLVDTVSYADQGLQLLTGFTMTEKDQEEMPSLILRRAGGEDLWDMAKATGSTVEDIRKANGIEGEIPVGKMLIIPVV